MNNMKASKGYRAFQCINTVIMILVIFVTLYPFIYLVAQSFSSDAAVSAGKVTFLPIDFNLNTYKYILRDNQFFKYYFNTIAYTVVSTFISVSFTALLAYPLSKPRLRLNKVITPMVVFTMYFAGGTIPNYIVVTQWLGLQDSVWSILLPNAISILPLSKPIIATMCLFYMVGMWNEWFTPMLYLDSKDKWPIALYVRQLVEGANNTEIGSSADASSVQATLKSATMVLTSIPIMCVYPFVQKYFVQGMTIGAVKG